MTTRRRESLFSNGPSEGRDGVDAALTTHGIAMCQACGGARPVRKVFGEAPVSMEAYSGLYHWARELGGTGHFVRLIAPHYVKPFIKRQKNDAADAAAIVEAAQRPTMRFVDPKSSEQQARAIAFRTASS